MLPEDQTATTDQGQADAPATTEAADSQDQDLDALLDEYKAPEPAPETTPEPTKDEEPEWAKSLRKDVQELRADNTETKVGDAIGKSVVRVAEFSEKLKEFPKALIEAHLRMRAEKDGRILKAFNDQFKNPEGWKRVERGLAKELDAMLSGVPDAKLTGDRKAALDAVKGQFATRPAGDSDGPTQAQISAMSDTQFKAHKATEFAKAGR